MFYSQRCRDSLLRLLTYDGGILGIERHIHLSQLIPVHLDESLAFAGALVEEAMLEAGLLLQVDTHLVEIDVVHLTRLVASHEASILRSSRDVVEIDVAHLAAATDCLAFGEAPVGIFVIAVGPWITGDVDRLGLSPPHVRPQAAVEHDIREDNIGHRTLVAVLDSYAAVRGSDDAVVDHHAVDAVHVLAANLDGARAAGHHTIGNDNIFAFAILLELTTVFQTNAVVARRDVAVGDTNLTRMVDINAVAIANLQIVEQRNTLDVGILAPHQVHGP